MKAVVVGLVAVARVAAADPAGWEVKLADRLDVPATGATLSLAIAVDRGLSISKDALVIVDLAPAAGVAIKKRRLGRADAVDPEADAPRFAIPVRGDAPGEHALAVRVRFWLCAKWTCRPVDVTRTVTAVVATPPPP